MTLTFLLQLKMYLYFPIPKNILMPSGLTVAADAAGAGISKNFNGSRFHDLLNHQFIKYYQ